MRRRTMAATAAGVLALAAGTTAIAAPGGGPFGLVGDPDERRADEAQALGKKLGVDPQRVERALSEVHRERHEARQDEVAAGLAKRLDVPASDAERALARAFTAARPELPGPGERPDRGEQPDRAERPPDRREMRDTLARTIAGSSTRAPRRSQTRPIPRRDGFSTLRLDGEPWRSLVVSPPGARGVRVQRFESLEIVRRQSAASPGAGPRRGCRGCPARAGGAGRSPRCRAARRSTPASRCELRARRRVGRQRR